MNFQTVFDLDLVGYKSWTFPGFGLIFVAITGALVFFRNMLPYQKEPSPYRKFSNYFGFGFSVLWVLITFYSTFSEYYTASRAYHAGSAHVDVGPVSNFVPMPQSGHADESFTVNGHEFHYSDFGITAGFNNTSSHGGPIQAGLLVRVTHVGNVIVRLEVAK